MPVTGIGGLFFRSNDPAALTAWYQEHLGIGSGTEPWTQQAGPTVFAPFPSTTDYFPPERQWMLNLRVSDLTDLVATLEAASVVVIRDAEWESSEYGRFARIHDPEGNPIELWEPPRDT